MSKLTIGIDLGLSGAVAVVDAGHTAQVRDLEVKEDGGGRYIDARSLIVTIRTLVDVRDVAMIVAENVRARPMGNGGRAFNSMQSQSSLLETRGIVRAVASIGGWGIAWVEPQAWKRKYGLTRRDADDDVKERARSLALTMFPQCAHDLARKKDHNRAEALLLARYGALAALDQ